jgi:gliding motility-associated-like protein
VYGATDPALTYSITGFVNGDTEADLDTGVSISRAAGENVDTYTITPSAAADSNYTVSFVTADFTITAADLTVTASDQTKVYGATDPTLTYSITGFVNGDTEADLDTGVSISRAAGEDVDTYTITPSAAADSNYTVSFVTADFTITAADLTVTADVIKPKCMGQQIQTLTYSITGFVNGDTEADLDTGVSISRAAGEDVDTYTITPSAAADSNYTVSFVTADFTITQTTLTITGLVGKNKVYDETTTASKTGDPILEGVLSNDDVSLGGSPVFTFESPNPGILIMITTTGYTITGSDSGNYILIQPTLYADITNPDEDCDGDGIIDSQDSDLSACASAIREVKRYGFSPNGDGINDGWTIENIEAYPNNVVRIFNRSGKLVFEQRGYQNNWNGESNQLSGNSSGYKLPVGPYLFMIDLGDGNGFIKGWLYINY